ncbi:MAG: DUF2752 domain-containing protein [Fuerstiella sp.]|jgi:hypothetical protein
MTESQPTGNDRPTRVERSLFGLLALGLLGVFAIAIALKPDPRGFGTHQQLGLPPCTFQSLTGHDCPHCGMTTSFANFVRGDFGAAWNANPVGIPLAVICAVCIPWWALVAVTGRWFFTKEPLRWLVFGAIGYVSLAVIVWVARVFVF